MSPSLARYAGELAAGKEAGESLRLLLADCPILVRSNSRELVERLADYFRSFLDPEGLEPEIEIMALETAPAVPDFDLAVKQPDPGKAKIKEEYLDLKGGRLVRKRLTKMLFLFGGPVNLALGPCLANSNQVINFVNNRFIQRELSSGSLLAHAAAVAAPDRGLALAGFSGMGKSTLALWMVSQGLDFISNDRLMVRRRAAGPAISGVAKQPRINPGTALANEDLAAVVPPADRRAFAKLPADQLWTLEHKYDALIEECFGPGRFRLAAGLDGLAILNWRLDKGPCRIQEVDLSRRPDLLGAFKKEPGLFFLPETPEGERAAQVADRDYLEALDGITVFEVGGGVDFQAAARELAGFLHGEGSGSRA